MRTLRRLIAVLVALAVVLGVAGVAAETVVRAQTQDILTKQLSTALGAPVTATLHDRIVLWSLARDRFGVVTGTAEGAVVGSGDETVTLDLLDFTAKDVVHPRDANAMRIGDLNAAATIGWVEAGRVVGVQLTHYGQGRVELRHEISIWGADVTISLNAVPGVDPGTRRFTLRDPKAQLAGVDVPQSLLVPLLDRLTASATLPDVMGMTYLSLSATPDGIVVNLHGTDVALPA